MNWPTFFTRTGSSIVFAAIMLTGLLWNEWAFLVLICLIQFLCLGDYFRLMQKIYPVAWWPAWFIPATQIIGLAWLLFTFVFSIKTIGFSIERVGLWLLCFHGLFFIYTKFSRPKTWPAGWQTLLGTLYITTPMAMLVAMRMHSILIPLSLILMIWTNDTMAYIVGSFIGKTPFSKISPKKTWEGTIGGAVLTIAGAATWGHYSNYYTMQDWIALALCAAVAGTLGDLLESNIKRKAGVKDSGSLMPGHGGALDRFDSLLLATPFAFAYCMLFMPPSFLQIF